MPSKYDDLDELSSSDDESSDEEEERRRNLRASRQMAKPKNYVSDYDGFEDGSIDEDDPIYKQMQMVLSLKITLGVDKDKEFLEEQERKRLEKERWEKMTPEEKMKAKEEEASQSFSQVMMRHSVTAKAQREAEAEKTAADAAAAEAEEAAKAMQQQIEAAAAAAAVLEEHHEEPPSTNHGIDLKIREDNDEDAPKISKHSKKKHNPKEEGASETIDEKAQDKKDNISEHDNDEKEQNGKNDKSSRKKEIGKDKSNKKDKKKNKEKGDAAAGVEQDDEGLFQFPAPKDIAAALDDEEDEHADGFGIFEDPDQALAEGHMSFQKFEDENEPQSMVKDPLEIKHEEEDDNDDDESSGSEDEQDDEEDGSGSYEDEGDDEESGSHDESGSASLSASGESFFEDDEVEQDESFQEDALQKLASLRTSDHEKAKEASSTTPTSRSLQQQPTALKADDTKKNKLNDSQVSSGLSGPVESNITKQETSAAKEDIFPKETTENDDDNAVDSLLFTSEPPANTQQPTNSLTPSTQIRGGGFLSDSRYSVQNNNDTAPTKPSWMKKASERAKCAAEVGMEQRFSLSSITEPSNQDSLTPYQIRAGSLFGKSSCHSASSGLQTASSHDTDKKIKPKGWAQKEAPSSGGTLGCSGTKTCGEDGGPASLSASDTDVAKNSGLDQINLPATPSKVDNGRDSSAKSVTSTASPKNSEEVDSTNSIPKDGNIKTEQASKPTMSNKFKMWEKKTADFAKPTIAPKAKVETDGGVFNKFKMWETKTSSHGSYHGTKVAAVGQPRQSIGSNSFHVKAPESTNAASLEESYAPAIEPKAQTARKDSEKEAPATSEPTSEALLIEKTSSKCKSVNDSQIPVAALSENVAPNGTVPKETVEAGAESSVVIEKSVPNGSTPVDAVPSLSLTSSAKVTPKSGALNEKRIPFTGLPEELTPNDTIESKPRAAGENVQINAEGDAVPEKSVTNEVEPLEAHCRPAPKSLTTESSSSNATSDDNIAAAAAAAAVSAAANAPSIREIESRAQTVSQNGGNDADIDAVQEKLGLNVSEETCHDNGVTSLQDTKASITYSSAVKVADEVVVGSGEVRAQAIECSPLDVTVKDGAVPLDTPPADEPYEPKGLNEAPCDQSSNGGSLGGNHKDAIKTKDAGTDFVKPQHGPGDGQGTPSLKALVAASESKKKTDSEPPVNETSPVEKENPQSNLLEVCDTLSESYKSIEDEVQQNGSEPFKTSSNQNNLNANKSNSIESRPAVDGAKNEALDEATTGKEGLVETTDGAIGKSQHSVEPEGAAVKDEKSKKAYEDDFIVEGSQVDDKKKKSSQSKAGDTDQDADELRDTIHTQEKKSKKKPKDIEKGSSELGDTVHGHGKKPKKKLKQDSETDEETGELGDKKSKKKSKDIDDSAELRDTVHAQGKKSKSSKEESDSEEGIGELSNTTHSPKAKSKKKSKQRDNDENSSEVGDTIHPPEAKPKKKSKKGETGESTSGLDDTIHSPKAKSKKKSKQGDTDESISELGSTIHSPKAKSKKKKSKKRETDESYSELGDTIHSHKAKSKKKSKNGETDESTTELGHTIHSTKAKLKKNSKHVDIDGSPSELCDSIQSPKSKSKKKSKHGEADESTIGLGDTNHLPKANSKMSKHGDIGGSTCELGDIIYSPMSKTKAMSKHGDRDEATCEFSNTLEAEDKKSKKKSKKSKKNDKDGADDVEAGQVEDEDNTPKCKNSKNDDTAGVFEVVQDSIQGVDGLAAEAQNSKKKNSNGEESEFGSTDEPSSEEKKSKKPKKSKKGDDSEVSESADVMHTLKDKEAKKKSKKTKKSGNDEAAVDINSQDVSPSEENGEMDSSKSKTDTKDGADPYRDEQEGEAKKSKKSKRSKLADGGAPQSTDDASAEDKKSKKKSGKLDQGESSDPGSQSEVLQEKKKSKKSKKSKKGENADADEEEPEGDKKAKQSKNTKKNDGAEGGGDAAPISVGEDPAAEDKKSKKKTSKKSKSGEDVGCSTDENEKDNEGDKKSKKKLKEEKTDKKEKSKKNKEEEAIMDKTNTLDEDVSRDKKKKKKAT